MSLTIAQRIDELVTRHGSLRAVARVLAVDAGYLSRLHSGEKAAPSGKLLRRMGLRQRVVYERATPTTPIPPAGQEGDT